MLDEKSSRPSRNWPDIIAKSVFVLLLMQLGAVMAAYLMVHGSDVATAIRIYGEPHPLPGANAPFRLDAINRHTGSTLRISELSASVTRADPVPVDPVVLPDMAEPSLVANWPVPLLPGRHRVTFNVHAPQVDGQPVEVGVESSVSGMPEIDWSQRPGRSAARNRSSIIVPPELYVAGADDSCPWLVSVSTPVGLVSAAIPSHVFIRVIEPAGAPVVALTIRIQSDGQLLREITTDSAGVAIWERGSGTAVNPTLQFRCLEVEAERQLRLTASQDAQIVTPDEPIQALDGRLSLRSVHRRAGDRWMLGVRCDNRWVHASARNTGPSAEERFVASMGQPGPAPDGILLCSVYRVPYWSNNPPFTSAWVLLHDDEIRPDVALQAAVRRMARNAPAALAPFFSQATLALIPSLTESERHDFARWLMGLLPSDFVPMPTLHDGIPEVVAHLEQTRGIWIRRLQMVLVAEVALVMVFLLGVILPGMTEQKRRMHDLSNEEDVSHDDRQARARIGTSWGQVALTLIMVSTFFIGLGILIGLLG